HTLPSALRWAVPMGLFAAVLGWFWFRTHAEQANTEIGSRHATGTASRLVTQASEVTNQRSQGLGFEGLLFEPGSAKLQPGSHRQLESIASILKTFPNVKLNIQGYTDNVGSAAQNLQLSRARAKAVEAQLVAEGISPNRLKAEGFGGRNPIA